MGYTLYKADYNPIPNHSDVNPLRVVFDQGNPAFNGNEPITANGKFQRIVHRSIDHLYYRDFLTNNKASFGSGNINKQVRFLEDQAYVLSIPQSNFGEAILPGSVKLYLNYTYFLPNTGSVVGVCNVIDDGYGNLTIQDKSYPRINTNSAYSFTQSGYISGSISKKTAGEWPTEDLYRYVNAGPESFSKDFNKGTWCMESLYNQVSVTFLTGSISLPTSHDLLGAVMNFTQSLSSSIEIRPNVSKDYLQKYNFENGDFTLSMMVMPSSRVTHPSGSVLLVKQGPVEEIRVDVNGNVHSQPIQNKTPYKLYISSGSTNLVTFERSSGAPVGAVDASLNKFALSSSIDVQPGTLYHVMFTKSGSIGTLVVASTASYEQVQATISVTDKECSNQANLYIGNTYTRDQGFNGVIDNVKIYRGSLNTTTDWEFLNGTLGVGNLNMGNVFYNHGMIVLTAIPTRFMNVASVESRGTHTIWENEISCTVGPGDFGMSCNPTLQEYDDAKGDFVFKSFATSSEFRPYVTSIGLYDDSGNLLAIGKLSQPIQTAANTNTTFIIRYDK